MSVVLQITHTAEISSTQVLFFGKSLCEHLLINSHFGFALFLHFLLGFHLIDLGYSALVFSHLIPQDAIAILLFGLHIQQMFSSVFVQLY